jgi:hypothetical protein
MEMTMKNVHASKKARHQKTTIRIMPCAFCPSRRVRFYVCGDDRGHYVAVACDACGAQGPIFRGAIGDDTITDQMRGEAAEAWNQIWNEIAHQSKPVIWTSLKPCPRRPRSTRKAPTPTPPTTEATEPVAASEGPLSCMADLVPARSNVIDLTEARRSMAGLLAAGGTR